MNKTSNHKYVEWNPFNTNPLDQAFEAALERQQKINKASIPVLNPPPPLTSLDSEIRNPSLILFSKKGAPIQPPISRPTQFARIKTLIQNAIPHELKILITNRLIEARSLWIEDNKEQAEQILLNCIKQLPSWYGNIDIELMLHKIYLLQNKTDEASLLIDTVLEISPTSLAPYVKKIESSQHLTYKKFHQLIEKLKMQALPFQLPIIDLTAAKYYLNRLKKTPLHDMTTTGMLNRKISTYISGFLENFKGNLMKIEYLENLAKETGLSFFLTADLLNAPHLSSVSKFTRDLRKLCYEELNGASFEELNFSYESLLERPLESSQILNSNSAYLKFLIRHGKHRECLDYINQRLNNSLLTKKTIRILKTLKANLLLTEKTEHRGLELIEDLLKETPALAPLWEEKANLHLNPLSNFYDLKKAEEALISTHNAPQYPDQYLAAWRLSFISDMTPIRSKKTIELLSDKLFGPSYLISLKNPEASLSEKIDLFFRDIETWLENTKSIYEARKTGTREDALVEAKRLYPTLSEESLYQLLSSPLGINKRTLHELTPSFNECQKAAIILGFESL